LLGYLAFGLLAAFILDFFPGETVLENAVFIALFLVFLIGFYFLWANREGLAGLIFMFWYAALWPLEIFIASDPLKDLPAPGIFMFVVAVLSIIYWFSKKKKKRQTQGS
jgi:hypothetical protein